MALKKHWNKGTNIIFLITDSPCHGLKYHDLNQKVESYKDSFPKGFYEGDIEEYKRRNIETLVEEFVKNNFNLICLDIHENTQKMFKMFEDKYNSKNKNKLFSMPKEDLVNCIIQKAFDLFEDIIKMSYDLVNDCDCESGCPACIYSSQQQTDDKYLNKEGTLLILKRLYEIITENKKEGD